MSIRGKILFWFLLPSLLIITATVMFSYVYTRAIVKQNILDGLEIAADALQEHVEMFLDEKRGRTIDFGSDGFVRANTLYIINGAGVDSSTLQLNRHLLYNKKPLDINILEVFVTDLDGNVISSTEINQIGRNVSDKGYFLKTMKRGHSVGDLHYFPELKQNTFEVAILITANGRDRHIGMLVNRYNGNSLRDITHSGTSELARGNQMSGLGETGELYIVNKDKLMITESRFVEDVIFKQVVDTEGVRRAFENGVGMIGIYPDYRGIPIIGVSRYIEEMDWVILSEKDVAEAFAPVGHLRDIFIVIVLSSVVVIVIVAIVLSRGMSMPIRKLVEGTKRVAEGDHGFRIDTKAKDEIGYLANSFNIMTTKLRESKKQLNDYADNLEGMVKVKAQEAIRARDFTENIIETAQDAMVCIDEDDVITVWNRSAEMVFGYSKDEIIGKPVITIIPDKYKEKHQDGMKRFLETHETAIIGKTIEIFGKPKAGADIPIELSVSFHKEGERYSFTAIIRDITEKKKAEEEREKLLNELSYRIKEQEQVIYATSHDLRSPLVNIMGFSKELGHSFKELESVLSEGSISSVMEEKLHHVLKEDIPESLRFILSSTAKMDSLVSGLLHVSRMGRTKLDIKRLDMNKIISDIISTFEHRIKKLDVTLKVEDLPSCNGDQVQINQVFSNLLDNALKYLSPDRPGIVKISGTRHLVYCVEDNGIGISEDHQDRIYEIFYRLNPEHSTGEGLGLTIIRKILDRHGGKIWCESRSGRGSKFFVSLPG